MKPRPTPDSIIAAVRSRGSDPRDLRDAVHESVHALQADVPPPWDRERLHGYLMRWCDGKVERMIDAEIRARAAEWHACKRFGIEYDADRWALLCLMETGKTLGVWLPSVEMLVARMSRTERAAETRRLVDRIARLS